MCPRAGRGLSSSLTHSTTCSSWIMTDVSTERPLILKSVALCCGLKVGLFWYVCEFPCAMKFLHDLTASIGIEAGGIVNDLYPAC